MTTFILSFALVGAFVALLIIICLIAVATEPRSYYNCCDGKCNQGRDCPARRGSK